MVDRIIRPVVAAALVPLFLAGCAETAVRTGAGPALTLTPELLKNAVLVSVDIQYAEPGHVTTWENMNPDFKRIGFTPDDINAANGYFFNSVLPNAARLTEFFRERDLPVVLIHWGARFADGMDLDPEVRKTFLRHHGEEFERWGHRVRDRSSQPHPALNPQTGDYILPKTAQDAFISSNIGFLLQNLEAKNLFMIGGHSGACLGKTAKSAKQAGYTIICIEDATFDATGSRRVPQNAAVGYDITCRTVDVLALP